MSDTLTYDELLSEIDKVPVHEKRIEQPLMREFVIPFDSITPLHLTLQRFFGEEFKAPGENPTMVDKKRAAPWGGIRQDQTLYYTEDQGYANCAMLWPWQEGRLCTVKLARFKK